ncbi:hypothetical protein DH2020_026578 [Rehmannia glutinosa]|uniref:Uncharacterized protein n=1 Tax=Rehmannia glutinosa TaxID=99300 RepID=A0ABR0W0L8_REHGL
MDGTRYTMTLDEFKLFHGIDRSLYLVLVKDLSRNPLECLYIMALWLWLEREGFYNLINKTLSLPPFLINELADEAVTCLKCVNAQFPFSSEASAEIPLTHSLVKKDISLQFFLERHLTAFDEIQNLVRGVCVPSMSDIMEMGCHGRFSESLTTVPVVHAAPSSVDSSLVQSISSLRISGDVSPLRGRGRANNETSRNDRTMFVTFSKGYPVTENEVRQFFTRLFGNCIESFHMQEVSPDEQSLYAKIVFTMASFIRAILSGVSKAKFTINGKHIKLLS